MSGWSQSLSSGPRVTIQTATQSVQGVPKQSHTRPNPRQIDDIVGAYHAGSTIKELAAHFQIHRTTVSKVLERRGVQRRYRPLTPAQIERTVIAYRVGNSVKTIGDLLGVDASTIWRTLRRKGVEVRR